MRTFEKLIVLAIAVWIGLIVSSLIDLFVPMSNDAQFVVAVVVSITIAIPLIRKV